VHERARLRSLFTQAALLAVLPGMAHALIPLRSYAPHTLPSSYANVAGRRKRVLIYVPRMQVEKVEEAHVSLHEEDRKRAEAKRLQEMAAAAHLLNSTPSGDLYIVHVPGH